MSTTYGYARVSTKDQNEARQLIAMHAFGIDDKHIFMDRQSGKDFNRPQYLRLIRRLRAGDTLVIKSIDRLGRNYNEIIEQWRIITKEKQVGIVVLDILQNLGTADAIEQLTAKLDRFDIWHSNAETVRLNIAASFTAEPIEGFLSQWAHKREKTLDVQFAPYNQIPQMLLNRSSLLYTQNTNYNIILFRAIDTVRHAAAVSEDTTALITNAYQELLSALQTYPADAPICIVSSFIPDSYEFGI